MVKPVEGEPLVIQYEVKLETPHNCGGMYVALFLLTRCYQLTAALCSRYIKLLKDNPDLIDSLEEFSGDTEYTIMFGPDKCGGTDKVRTKPTAHTLDTG